MFHNITNTSVTGLSGGDDFYNTQSSVEVALNFAIAVVAPAFQWAAQCLWDKTFPADMCASPPTPVAFITDDLLNRKGIQTESDGTKIYGQFKDGKLQDGRLKVEYSDGSVYEGKLKNGLLKVKYSDGSVYHGPSKDGQPSGDGIAIKVNKDGSKYGGSVSEGNKKTGKGIVFLGPNFVIDGKRLGETPNNEFVVIGDFENGQAYNGAILKDPQGNYFMIENYDPETLAITTSSLDPSDKLFAKADSMYAVTRIKLIPLRSYQKTQFSDGTYIGLLNQYGSMHGWGTFLSSNGDTYSGEFENGHLKGFNTQSSGFVKIARTDGYFYEGYMVNGTKEGQANYTMPDALYEGQFKNNKFDGHGKLRLLIDKTIYEGDWEADKKHGKGIYTDADGGKYEGDWEADKKHGKGIYTDADGGKYEGDWEADKKHGKGIYTDADGRKYEGDWKADKKDGKGKYTYANIKTYEGNWKADKMHGIGEMIKTGVKYFGNFEENLIHGQGISIFSKGQIYIGTFQKNKIHGEGMMTFNNGNVIIGQFVKYMPQAGSIFIFNNGTECIFERFGNPVNYTDPILSYLPAGYNSAQTVARRQKIINTIFSEDSIKKFAERMLESESDTGALFAKILGPDLDTESEASLGTFAAVFTAAATGYTALFCREQKPKKTLSHPVMQATPTDMNSKPNPPSKKQQQGSHRQHDQIAAKKLQAAAESKRLKAEEDAIKQQQQLFQDFLSHQDLDGIAKKLQAQIEKMKDDKQNRWGRDWNEKKERDSFKKLQRSINILNLKNPSELQKALNDYVDTQHENSDKYRSSFNEELLTLKQNLESFVQGSDKGISQTTEDLQLTPSIGAETAEEAPPNGQLSFPSDDRKTAGTDTETTQTRSPIDAERAGVTPPKTQLGDVLVEYLAARTIDDELQGLSAELKIYLTSQEEQQPLDNEICVRFESDSVDVCSRFLASKFSDAVLEASSNCPALSKILAEVESYAEENYTVFLKQIEKLPEIKNFKSKVSIETMKLLVEDLIATFDKSAQCKVLLNGNEIFFIQNQELQELCNDKSKQLYHLESTAVALPATLNEKSLATSEQERLAEKQRENVSGIIEFTSSDEHKFNESYAITFTTNALNEFQGWKEQRGITADKVHVDATYGSRKCELLTKLQDGLLGSIRHGKGARLYFAANTDTNQVRIFRASGDHAKKSEIPGLAKTAQGLIYELSD